MGGATAAADEAYARAALTAFEKYPRDAAKILNPRAWLMTLTYHVCMDLHRERRTQPSYSLDEVAQEPRALADQHTPSPERSLLATELETLISLSIRELPERLRQPMELVAGGVGYRDVADALGITELNVRKRIQKAREELRRRLSAYRRGDCRLGTELQPPTGWRHSALVKVEREEPLAVVAVGWTRVLSAQGVERDHLLWLRQPVSGRAAARLRRLRAYIARHPGGWRKRLELARLFCEIDRSEEAVAHYQVVVESHARYLPAWLELGELLRRLGRPAQEDEVWRHALGTLTRLSERLLVHGLRARDRDPETAVAFLAAATEPDRLHHRLLLGQTLLEMGRPAAAMGELEPAQRDAPDNPAALYLSCRALVANGRPAAARRRAERALAGGEAEHSLPLVALLVTLRCRARAVTGAAGEETDGWLELLRRRAADRFATHRCELRLALSRGAADAALHRALAFADAHPAHAAGLLACGDVFAWQGRRTEAVRWWRRAARLEPGDARLQTRLLRRFARARRATGLALAAAELVDRFPGVWDAVSTGALLLARLQPGTRGVAELSRAAVRLQPSSPTAWLRHGSTLARLGRGEEASAALASGWELAHPAEGDAAAVAAALELGRLRMAAGDVASGAVWLQRAIDAARALADVDPVRAAWWSFEGWTALGRRPEAEGALRELLHYELSVPMARRAFAALERQGAEEPTS